MRILIVEGNTEALMRRNEQVGRPLAWQTWEKAIRLHAPDATIEVTFPYSGERDGKHAPAGDFDACVLTGSSVAWNAMDERALPFLQRIEPMLASGKPVLGACWGLQIAAVALGGKVGANPKGSEIGMARLELTPAGMSHPVFAGTPRKFASPTWHRDHVTQLPEGAVVLAHSQISPVQAMAFQNGGVDFTGFQYHPEAEVEDFRKGFEANGAQPDSVSVIVDFPDEPPAEVANPMLRTLAVGNWLRLVKSGLV